MTEKPINPRYVLIASILLPASGHVLQGRQQRGLMFLFFMIILAWSSTKVMPADASFFGRHIGGLFIYGISVIDAYKWSRVKWETWKFAQTHDPG